jgi:hypothetical protein
MHINIVAQLGFDARANLYVFVASPTAPLIIKRKVPLSTELKSPRAPTTANPTLQCLFSVWDFTSLPEYHLDKGESISLKSTLVSTIGTSNSISVLNTKPDSISVKTNRTNPWETRDVISVEEADVQLMVPRFAKQGRAEVVVMPSKLDFTCPKTQQVRQLNLGNQTIRWMSSE